MRTLNMKVVVFTLVFQPSPLKADHHDPFLLAVEALATANAALRNNHPQDRTRFALTALEQGISLRAAALTDKSGRAAEAFLHIWIG